jgi:hypothetical protein
VRDQEIVRAVYEYRALTTPLVQALLFSPNAERPDTRCKRRLQLLHHAGYLARDEQPTRLSDGRKPLVYFLDERGAELLSEFLNVPRRTIDWRPEYNDVGWLFLEHLLATNTVRVAISVAARRHGWRVRAWLDDKRLRRSEARDHVELPGQDGATYRVAIVPDGYFALQVGKRVYHRFVEADRGTVTGQASKEQRRDWVRKVRAYLAYYESGQYLDRYGARGLRVLTVTTSERRLGNLKQITEAAGGWQMFYFTTFDRLRSADPLTDPIWQIAASDGLHPLIGAA